MLLYDKYYAVTQENVLNSCEQRKIVKDTANNLSISLFISAGG